MIFFLLANQGASSQQTYLPDFMQAQEPQPGYQTFAAGSSHRGVVSPATQMQYGAMYHPATMHDMPAWFQPSAVQQGVCNSSATPSFPVDGDIWNSSILPAVDLNHAAAHHMNANACPGVENDNRLDFGKPPLPNSASKAPALSNEETSGDAIASGSSTRTCSCPICLDLHTSPFFIQKLQAPTGVPREQYSCRLPACDWMARGLDGAAANRYTNALLRHEESHFGQKGRFTCLEERCLYVTKRWGDLMRHYSSKHCTNGVRRFVCPVVWCKYSRGGFARKDKLRSHVKSVHGEEAEHGGTRRAGQAIRPKGQDGL